MIEVTEYTDPLCSWAWGAEPKLRKLHLAYDYRMTWRRVMGGLLPYGWHKHYLVEDPEYLEKVISYQANVNKTTGMIHPARLDWAGLSSIEGCRAVKAAERQGPEAADRLLRRLRESWYIFGRPADTVERILEEAATVPGVDPVQLAVDLADPAVEAAYQADWEETRNPNEASLNYPDERVGRGQAKPDGDRMRYGFPTLIFRGPAGEHTVPGWQPWEAYVAALEAVFPGASADPRPMPTPEEALAEFRVMAQLELDTIYGPGAGGPAGAVEFNSGGGLVWLLPEEAAVRRAATGPQLSSSGT